MLLLKNPKYENPSLNSNSFLFLQKNKNEI